MLSGGESRQWSNLVNKDHEPVHGQPCRLLPNMNYRNINSLLQPRFTSKKSPCTIPHNHINGDPTIIYWYNNINIYFHFSTIWRLPLVHWLEAILFWGCLLACSQSKINVVLQFTMTVAVNTSLSQTSLFLKNQLPRRIETPFTTISIF